MRGWRAILSLKDTNDPPESSSSRPPPMDSASSQGVLLSFTDAQLESAYRAECAEESFKADCGLYLLACTVWFLIWHKLYASGASRAPWAVANAAMCCGTLLFMRLRPAAYMRRRTLIISATKIVATVFATELIMLPGPSTDSWLGTLSALGVLSKASMLLFTACFMQIPFPEHLLVQAIQVVYCIMHNGRMCALLETRFLGLRAHCARLARELSAASFEAQAPLKMRARSLSDARSCECVCAYLQVIFGYVLSMLLLYELEARSRAAFLRARLRRCGAAPLPQLGATAVGGPCLAWITIPAFFMLSGLVVWEVVEAVWELADSLA